LWHRHFADEHRLQADAIFHLSLFTGPSRASGSLPPAMAAVAAVAAVAFDNR